MVIEAYNGKQAVDLAKLNNPGLILMDLRMPVMDGYQATEQIKAFLDVPIIALTASVMKGEFERTKSSQFSGYLRKPVLRSDLFKELTRFIAYDTIEVDEQIEAEVILSDNALAGLPEVLEKLEQLSVDCEAVRKSNNITNIKELFDTIFSVGNEYDVNPLIDYANQLNESFEIAEILSLLKRFPDLQEMLKGKLEAN